MKSATSERENCQLTKQSSIDLYNEPTTLAYVRVLTTDTLQLNATKTRLTPQANY